MKKALLVLLLAAGGYLAYRQLVLEPPVRAFRRFAEAWGKEDTPAAAALTEGDVAKKAVELHILRGVVQAPMEALGRSHVAIESRVDRPDGDVVLTARELVLFDPPGMTSAFAGAMAASVRHVATMHKGADGWRVVAWAPEFLEAHSTRPGR